MPSPETLAYNLEADHSAEVLHNPWVKDIVEDSIGKVGVNLNAQLSSDQKKSIVEKMLKRNPDANQDQLGAGLFSQRNGYIDYGERAVQTPYEERDDLGINKINKEEIHFVDLGDGRTDVQYIFTDPRYFTAEHRPGNVLKVTFPLTAENAKLLRDKISLDPRAMDQVVEAQLRAIGFEGKALEAAKPHMLYDPHPDKDPNQLTGLDDDRRRTVIFEHTPDGRIEDRKEVTVGEAKERLKITANIETDEHAKEAFEAVEYYYMMARGQKIEPDKILNPVDYKNMEGANDMVREAAEEVLALNIPYDELEKLLKTVREEFSQSPKI